MGFNASLCNGNSAEPPSILIIVTNAPDDLEISMGPAHLKARREDKATESHFSFYRSELKTTDNIITVTTGGKTFEVSPDVPLQNYKNIFTLDLKNQKLIPGTPLSRTIGSVSMRVFLTLLIEAIIFFLFGYRSKRSWLVFVIVNLFTQAGLNYFLINNVLSFSSYLIFSLIALEIVVFIVELLAFSLFVNEHRRSRTALYVFTANLLGLLLGGYLITVLPT
jgi:hypothetical protein